MYTCRRMTSILVGRGKFIPSRASATFKFNIHRPGNLVINEPSKILYAPMGEACLEPRAACDSYLFPVPSIRAGFPD